MSHCVNYTTRDIIDHWDKNMSSIVLLENGKSCLLCAYFQICVLILCFLCMFHI